MNIRKQLVVDAPIGRVWEVLGPEFDRVDAWASSVYRSSARHGGHRIDGAPCSGRMCETSIGDVRESLTVYDKERYVVGYDAKAEGMPSFVKGLSNQWSLSRFDEGRTRVETHMRAVLMAPFSVVMGPVMRLQMGSILQRAIVELKFYVEHGKPHPRKVRAGRKVEQQAV